MNLASDPPNICQSHPYKPSIRRLGGFQFSINFSFAGLSGNRAWVDSRVSWEQLEIPHRRLSMTELGWLTHFSLLRLGYKVHDPPSASLQNAKRSTAFNSYEPMMVSSGPGRPQMRDVRGYHARKTMKKMILQAFTFLIKFLLKKHQI